MIQEGKYRAKAVTADFGAATNTKSQFVQVEFKITEGDCKGWDASWTGWLTPAAQDRTIEALRTCGCIFPNNDITNLMGFDSNEVQIVIKHEEYTNAKGETKTAAKVAFVNRVGGIAPQAQMDRGAKAALAARMKGALVASAAKAPAQAAAQAASSQPTGADDDIPF